jgi:predicted MFS family arabinose efflux permease
VTATEGISGTPFRLMLVATALGFTGYALLLPVVPLWAAYGGSGAFGAGATTGVLMLTTVATQPVVPWLLRRLDHRWVLGLGMALLAAAPLHIASADLGPVLVVSALRGVGFGMATVAGSALVAELVPPAQLGRASAGYGLAVGLPQLGLLPGGVAVVEHLGFTAVFVAAGAVPLLGAALMLAVRMPGEEHPPPAAGAPALSAMGPLLAMLACSIAHGGLITFLPLAVPGGGPVVLAALFGTAAGVLLGRLVAGQLVDRRGWGGRLLRPGVLLAAAGMGLEVVGFGALVVIGAVVVGLGFGLVQNDALTVLFVASGPARYGAASAAWNVSYDAGTGIGAVGLGAVAEPFGFAAAFGASALVCAGTALGVVRRAQPRAARRRAA